MFLHLLTTVPRLAGPGGARSVVAESVLVKHQRLILNRSRKRSPNLRVSDRMVAGCSCPGRRAPDARVRHPEQSPRAGAVANAGDLKALAGRPVERPYPDRLVSEYLRAV